MKYILTILLIKLPIILVAQFEFGWRTTYNGDSLRVEKFRENNLVKSIGTYQNGQVKYIRYLDKSQIVDTVKYFSNEGKLESKVHYKDLSYELVDTTYISNYLFVDTCIMRVKEQILSTFENSIIENYLIVDGSNSSQQSRVFNKHYVSNSKLYEPEKYPIKCCWIMVSSKYGNDLRPLINFRIDSTMIIVQSNIDLRKKYNFNIPIEYADSIKTKFNWRAESNGDWKEDIVVNGPYLEVRSKEIKWVIQRTKGNMVIDNHFEEIEIDTETGDYVKTMKYIYSPDCY